MSLSKENDASSETSSSDNDSNSSLSLHQLKMLVNESAKAQNSSLMHWEYADADTLQNELNDFFNHSEIPLFEECRRLFERHYPKKWTKSSRSRRRDFIALLLESLEIKNLEKRIEAAKELLYIAQGVFGEHNTQENHIATLHQNNEMIRRTGGLSTIYQALRGACSSADILARASSGSATSSLNHSPISRQALRKSVDKHIGKPSPLKNDVPSERNNSNTNDISNAWLQQALDAANREVMLLFDILYVCIESGWRMTEKSHTDRELFRSELENLQPPLIPYLIQLLPVLSDGKHKHFPVKKLIMLLWKSLLALLGGREELKELKAIARKKEGLTESGLALMSGICTKSTPYDYAVFYNEMLRKYPSVTLPPPLTTIITNLYPRRRVFSSRRKMVSLNDEPKLLPELPFEMNAPTQITVNNSCTDTSFIPIPIRESLDVYMKYMYVSLSTIQMQQEVDLVARAKRNDKLPLSSSASLFTTQQDNSGENNHNLSEFFMATPTLIATKRPIANEQLSISDSNRLNRIDHLYRHILPNLTPIVIAILKLLLAGAPNPKCYTINMDENPGDVIDELNTTETSIRSSPDMARASYSIPTTLANGPLTLEQIALSTLERNRHREILTKGLSGILALLIKHLSCYHTLMFEYLAQIMVDSNCVLLLLKTLNFHHFSQFLTARNEVEDMNFFNYASSQSTKHPGEITRNNDQSQRLCWRNAFLSYNLLQVLHKLTKHKSGRILAMVQHKSPAILKRVLKCNCTDITRWALKLLRSQIPFAGRKWRHDRIWGMCTLGNMKVITAIYQHLRPDLCNDYLVSSDADVETKDAQSQDMQMRELIASYHQRHFPEVFVTPFQEVPKEESGDIWQLIRDLSEAQGEANMANDDDNNRPPLYPSSSAIDTNGNDEHVDGNEVRVLSYLAESVENIVLDEDFLSGGYEDWLRAEVYGEDYDIYDDSDHAPLMLSVDDYNDGEDGQIYPDQDEVNDENLQESIGGWKDELEEQY